MLVGDGQPLRGVLLQFGHDGRGVGGVGHQEDLVVGDVVGDQIVHNTAGLGAAQGVLRLARSDPVQVVGEGGIDVGRRTRAFDQSLSEVADVEEAHGVARGVVFGDSSGVGHRHQPSTEFGETGSQFTVAVFQWSVQQIVSHGFTLICTPERTA